MIMEQKLYAACVALAVFALAMAIPQGSALARGGMELRTADLCLTGNADGSEVSGIGTVAAVTDNRLNITAWAVSLEELSAATAYAVYHDGPNGDECKGASVYSTTMTTNSDGNAFENSGGPRPEVGDFVRVCRLDPVESFNPTTVSRDDLIAILSGVLVKGGKENNKPGRCR